MFEIVTQYLDGHSRTDIYEHSTPAYAFYYRTREAAEKRGVASVLLWIMEVQLRAFLAEVKERRLLAQWTVSTECHSRRKEENQCTG